MKTIDINCDLGEGIGNDELIMPYISSANIACGYHAGDEKTMKQTVELCKKYSVAVGANPSYPDKENFGRTDMLLHPGEIYEMIVKQINSLEKIAAAADVPIHHIKPHGALYNMAARDKGLAPFVALAILDTNSKYLLYGLSGSYLVKEGTVTSITGKKVPIVAETICIHGDGEHVVEFAKAIHAALKENNIAIKART